MTLKEAVKLIEDKQIEADKTATRLWNRPIREALFQGQADGLRKALAILRQVELK